MRTDAQKLLVAAFAGNLVEVRRLVNNGVDVNTKGVSGETPLSLAVWRGYLKVVEFLAGKGADMETRDTNGQTPVEMAAINGNLKVIEFVKEVIVQRQIVAAVGNLTKSAAKR